MEVFKQDQYAIVQDLLQRQDDALIEIDKLNEAVELAINDLSEQRASEIEQEQQEQADPLENPPPFEHSPSKAVSPTDLENETLKIAAHEKLADSEQNEAPEEQDDDATDAESSKAA